MPAKSSRRGRSEVVANGADDLADVQKTLAGEEKTLDTAVDKTASAEEGNKDKVEDMLSVRDRQEVQTCVLSECRCTV